MDKTRRDFLKQATLASASTGLMHFLPASLVKAMAIDPAKGSTYLDAEHIIFLMQENRSFDHTFGTLQGVRGFDDPRAIDLPDGRPVWMQSNEKGQTFAPFRLDLHHTKATWMNSLPHSWPNQVDARNNGLYDQWLPSKPSGNEEYRDMPLTLGYHTREDIPFYYALADAFTVCDHNFCSSLTGTTPNRLYFWSGTIREKEDEQELARVYNSDADYDNQVNWKTFPERLEEAGIPWRVYQNEISAGVGLEGEADSWLANFTDNPLEFFSQYNVKLSPEYIANLPLAEIKFRKAIKEKETELADFSGTPDEKESATNKLEWLKNALEKNQEEQKIFTRQKFDALDDFSKNIHRKAFTNNRNDKDYHKLGSFTYKDAGVEREVKIPKGDILHQFREDVSTGRLPMVSWLVPPENFSDHPSSAWYGSWYISEVMKILTDNPEVWKKTIFILTYDENDGYFDHVPPFVPPHPYKPETGLCSEGIKTATEYVIGKEQQSDKDNLRESPVGLGYRVPLLIASPWTRGGWVNSQVFDHTSSLQFLEKFLSAKTGKKITEPNINKWRRTVCGDLTSVFREYKGEKIRFPDSINKQKFITGIHKAQFKKLPDDFVSITPGNADNPLPRLQEKGTRPANAIPYEPYADLVFDKHSNKLELIFTVGNQVSGALTAGSPFTVYNLANYKHTRPLPRNYAVTPGSSVRDTWELTGFDTGRYHLRVHGPNGFFREFKGSSTAPAVRLNNKMAESANNRMHLHLDLHNDQTSAVSLRIVDHYQDKAENNIDINAGDHSSFKLDLSGRKGWYDVSVFINGNNDFLARYAGRIETGGPSVTDPLMGNALT
ncbi:MAG: phospholipase C, phosphocholine-specific [Chitinophagaceae bacterium]